MKFASYNIQYGTGKDGRVDIDRICREIEGADIMALQEVDRCWERSGNADLKVEIAANFPDYYWVYGAGLDLEGGYKDDSGRVVHRRRQFGNMLLSRTPILATRNHTLPKLGMVEQVSMHRSALEGVIETPSGPLRVFSVHLAHSSAPERLSQIAKLQKVLNGAQLEGAALTGPPGMVKTWGLEGAPPPLAHSAILMGDFNLKPCSSEYVALCGPMDDKYGRITALDGLIDCWVAAGNDPEGGGTMSRKGGSIDRIDYAFVTADLARKVESMRVDAEAQGSDHQPIWVDLDL